MIDNNNSANQIGQRTIDPVSRSSWTRRIVNIGLIITIVPGLLFAGAIYGQVVVALFVSLLLLGPIRYVKSKTDWSYKQVVILVFILYMLTFFLLLILIPIPIVQFAGDFVESINQMIEQLTLSVREMQVGSAMNLTELSSVSEPITRPLSTLSEDANSAIGVMVEMAVGFVGSIIYPRIVGKSVDVSPIVIIVALPFFGSIGGVLGMFLSPVLVAVFRDLVIYVFHKMNGTMPFAAEPIPDFMQTNIFVEPIKN